MRELLFRLIVASALLPALLVGAASPAAGWDENPTAPRKGIPYRCTWIFTDGPHKGLSGISVLTFTEIVCNRLPDGNTLCRPVTTRTDYPGGGVRHARWTIAKPFSCGPRCSTWEVTINQPPPQIQCKDSRVQVTFERPGEAHFDLDFDCDNHIEMSCEAP